MESTMTRARRLLAFVIVPALGIVSPLLALPALTAAHGATAWAAIAVGLSLGSGGAVIAELGWALTGPQRVARTSRARARYYFALSLVTKLLSITPVMLIASVLAFVLFPLDRSLSVLAAIAGSATGLSQNWFFIGRGAPGKILFFDTLPRVAFVVFSAILLTFGAPAEAYVLLGLLVPSLLSPLLGVFVVGLRPAEFKRWKWNRLVYIMRSQLPAVSGRLASSIYIAIPSALVGMISPSSVAHFAAVERLTRMSLSVLAAVPNYLQKYVGEVSTLSCKISRSLKAIFICLLVGVVSGTGYAILVPYVADYVFTGTVEVDPSLAWTAGGIILVVCVSRATGNIGLVTVRRITSIMRSAMLGALVGLPLIVVLALRWGALGALMGMLVAEIAVLCYQLISFRRAARLIRTRIVTPCTAADLSSRGL